MTARKKAPKSVQLSFRMTEECRDLLLASADITRRSQANVLEIAIRDFAERTNLTGFSAYARVKTTKKAAAKVKVPKRKLARKKAAKKKAGRKR